MVEKVSKMRVWKLKIDEKVERETIEAALSDACKKAMQKGYLEGAYGLIERVDIKEKETVVFISENPKTAQIFSDTLGAFVPRKKVTLSEVSRADITKFV
jgi:hypothetical protein